MGVTLSMASGTGIMITDIMNPETARNFNDDDALEILFENDIKSLEIEASHWQWEFMYGFALVVRRTIQYSNLPMFADDADSLRERTTLTSEEEADLLRAAELLAIPEERRDIKYLTLAYDV